VTAPLCSGGNIFAFRWSAFNPPACAVAVVGGVNASPAEAGGTLSFSGLRRQGG